MRILTLILALTALSSSTTAAWALPGQGQFDLPSLGLAVHSRNGAVASARMQSAVQWTAAAAPVGLGLLATSSLVAVDGDPFAYEVLLRAHWRPWVGDAWGTQLTIGSGPALRWRSKSLNWKACGGGEAALFGHRGIFFGTVAYGVQWLPDGWTTVFTIAGGVAW